jgi:elongation factor P
VISTSEFRAGAKIEIDHEPYVIVECQHIKPGKGAAFVRTRLKSLKSGNILEKNIRSGEKFDEPNLEEKEVQFLYRQGDEHYFMDTRTYEQFFLGAVQLGPNRDLLKENMVVTIQFYNGAPLTVELPVFVEMKIVSTAPGIRGDTATGGTKPATLESGAVIKVPLHIEEGTVIKIDTRTRAYVERVK